MRCVRHTGSRGTGRRSDEVDEGEKGREEHPSRIDTALITPEDYVGDSIGGGGMEKRRAERGEVQRKGGKDRILVGLLTPEAGVWVDEDTLDVESSQSSQLQQLALASEPTLRTHSFSFSLIQLPGTTVHQSLKASDWA